MAVVVMELVIAFAIGILCVTCSIRMHQELSRETSVQLPYRRVPENAFPHSMLETTESETEFDVSTDNRSGFFSRLFRSMVS